MAQPLVGVVMGSSSDLSVMRGATSMLEKFEVPYEERIISAHRTPRLAFEYGESAVERGLEVIIAGAGKAAHLAGVLASLTPIPVIGVPIPSQELGGLDSLLSTVQMPSGVVVACVAIGGAKNAAILATQILAAKDPAFRDKIVALKEELAEQVGDKYRTLGG